MQGKKDLIIFLFMGAAALVLCFVKLEIPALEPECALFFFNETASLPRGIYLKIPAWDFKEGDYVVYQPPAEVRVIAERRGWLKDKELFLKKIGALEGTDYRINPHDGHFYIREKYVGNVFASDRDGQAMPTHYGRFVVPMGSFLPVGTAPRSFDGRYTGTVPMENIRAKVVPLLTEG